MNEKMSVEDIKLGEVITQLEQQQKDIFKISEEIDYRFSQKSIPVQYEEAEVGKGYEERLKDILRYNCGIISLLNNFRDRL